MRSDTDHTDDLVELLRARGQRVTSQRLVILRELRRRAVHATAHEVHEAVRAELPGTSTPTVYATLELLAGMGLVRKLDLGVGVALYDARTDAHQHAVCRRCGAVEDVDGEIDAAALLTAAKAQGFAADHAALVISGLCRRCQQAAPGTVAG